MRKALSLKSHTIRLLYALSLLLLFAANVSFNDKTPLVTLQVNNLPLEKVIDEIKKQTGYYFLYEQGLLNAKNVTITIKDATIQEALNAILNGQKLVYKIFDKTVVIRSQGSIQFG